MESSAADLQNRILALVRNILGASAIQAAELDPSSRLTDVGLTSMDLVALLLRVEAEFDITIPQVEITSENFLSIESLRRLIWKQQGAQARGHAGAGL